MTKRIFAMLLAVVMVVGLLPMNVFAGTAADRTKYTAPLAAHDSSLHICEHCVAADGTTTTPPAEGWTPWGDDEAEKTSLPKQAGHYYLTGPINPTTYADPTSGDVVICLNGQTLTANGSETKYDRFYYLKGSANLTIVDCTASGEGDTYKAGKLTGAAGSAIMTYDASGTSRSTGSVNIYDGIFEGNSNNTAGGALAIQGNTTLNIYGGRFANNTAGYGGAINTIRATNAVYIEDAVFTGNVGTNGAGVLCSKSPLTLKNVTIRNNTTKGSTAANGLGAISLCAKNAQPVALQGNVVISGNTDGATTPANRNLYVNNAAQTVTVSNLADTASVGVTLAAGKGTFTEALTDADTVKTKFTADDAQNLQIGVQDGKLVVEDKTVVPPTPPTGDKHEHTCQHCGGTANVEWTPWGDDADEQDKLPGLTEDTIKHYYLTKDLSVTAADITTGHIVLCLNGKTVTAAGQENNKADRFYNLTNDAKLTIVDCHANEADRTKRGTFTGSSYQAFWTSGTNATGQINVYAGIFDGNISAQAGAVFCMQTEAKLNIYGGEFTNNTASGKNGGVIYTNNAKNDVHIENAYIAGNKANSGAVLYANSYAKNVVKNSVIENNQALTGNGGAFRLYSTNANNSTKLTITGGEIKNNSAAGMGGVVYADGKANITVDKAENATTGTTVTGNSGAGAGVIYTKGSITLDGAQITGNTTTDATNTYGAVTLANADAQTITLKGDVKIENNTNGDTTNPVKRNLYLTNAANRVAVSNLADTASVGVALAGGMGLFAEGVNNADTYQYCFASDVDGIYVHAQVDTLILSDVVPAPPHSHCICGVKDCADTNHSGNKVFNTWGEDVSEQTSLPASGSYHLVGDINLSGVQEITGNMNLCLHGHTITAKSGARHFTVKNGATLTITDCGANEGKIGVITGGTSNYGGAINVNAGGTLNLYNGSFEKNQVKSADATGQGGTIYLQAAKSGVPGGTVNVYGGTISGGKAYDGGAIYAAAGSDVNMYGGTIRGNEVTNYGGGIYSTGGNTIDVKNAKFEGNSANTGGAIYVSGSNSVLNITGTTFHKNSASNAAGAVLAQSKNTEVAITGATFTENNAPSGGAAYISKNVNVTVTGGSFTGNTAKNGAAIYTAAAATTLDGTQITGNTADNNGAVYMNADAQALTLKGQAKILGNMAKGRANNLYLTGTKLISMDALAEDARIGISVEKYDRFISTQNDTDFSKNFVSDSPYRVISYKDKALYLANSTEHTHCTCAGAAASGCEHGNVVWEAYEESNALPTKDGHYYLTKDVVLTNQVWIANKNITICLNGHTVTAAKDARLITVQAGTVLNITDCGSGKLTGGNKTFGGAINVNAGGTLNLFGGTLTGNQSNDKTPLPEKADLMQGQGGAIYLQKAKDGLPGGVLNMYGGTISGNKASLGGGIYAAATTSLNIYGGTISNNQAVAYGGATYSTGGIVTNIENAKFEGNTAEIGGAVYVSGTGSKLNVKNATFHKNTAQSAAGAILAQSKQTVIDINGCTFTGNQSIGSGGAVYASANTTLKLDNSTFTGNTAEQGASLYALRATSTVGKVTMEGNKTATTKAKPTLRAAGIYVSGGEMTIDGAVIKNNQGGSGTAITTGAAKATVDGEQVTFYPTVNFVSGTISGNKGTSGGAILLQSKTVFNMKGGQITGNSASEGGAIYVSTNATFNMAGGTISGNSTKNNGGAIYALRSTLNLKGGTIKNNVTEKMGGAIYLSGAKLYQSGATITANKAEAGTGGGAIATGIRRDGDNKYEPYIKISGGTISNNSGKHGGGILLQGSEAVMDMTGGLFTGNQCKGDGAAIYVSTGTTLNMTGGKVTGNTSEGRSGAIHHLNSEGNYTNVEICGNSSKTSAGAMVVTGIESQVKMKNVKLYEHSSATAGTILVQGKAKLTLEKVEIYNSASTGTAGAIYISTNSYLNVIDSNIHDCKAENYGGALYFANHTHVNVDGLTLQNNATKAEGGGIYTRGVTSFYKNMKLIGNTASGNGAGFHMAYPAVQGVTGMIIKPDFKTGNVMENVQFQDNHSDMQGGGLYVHKGGFVTLKNAEFTGNTSGMEGSAVYAQGDFIMNGMTATGNTSKMDGYAVYLADVEYDNHSYTSGLNRMAGDVIVKDNQGGDMYLGETTTIVILPEGLSEKAEIHVTLASGVLTNKVQGAYHYEGGDLVYVITYGDRSLTEPEYDEALANKDKEDSAIGDVLLYVGIGVFVLAIAAVVVVLILKKKKKAPVADGAQE